MNRIIKFRAWDKRSKIMTEDVFFKPQSEEILLLQFTGLLDKNGKEIYEGDIVNHLYFIEIAQVVWNEKSAKFQFNFVDGSKDKILQVDSESYEIIGNIYENSDLLLTSPRE